MDLRDLRNKIDTIDEELVKLLGRRAEIALEVKGEKEKAGSEIYSPEREQEIINRAVNFGEKSGLALSAQSLENVFRAIVGTTRALVGDTSVAYLGPECSLSHAASLQQFGGQVKYRPRSNAEEIVREVEGGNANYGVLPLETATHSLVSSVVNALMQTKLNIIAEIELTQSLGLLSAGDGLSQVKRIYGDLQLFAQCTKWLNKNFTDVEKVVSSNLHRMAERVAMEKDAVLLSPITASELFALKLVAKGIEDDAGSSSRLIVVGEKCTEPTGYDKTSIVCSLEDRAGALIDVLTPFSERELTLTKIESKPMRARALEYVFFLEVLGHAQDERVAQAIKALKSVCRFCLVLGSYPLVVGRVH